MWRTDQLTWNTTQMTIDLLSYLPFIEGGKRRQHREPTAGGWRKSGTRCWSHLLSWRNRRRVSQPLSILGQCWGPSHVVTLPLQLARNTPPYTVGALEHMQCYEAHPREDGIPHRGLGIPTGIAVFYHRNSEQKRMTRKTYETSREKQQRYSPSSAPISWTLV